MRSTLSLRVESFEVADGVLLLPIGQGTQRDRFISDLADAICADFDQWGAAIAGNLLLCKVLDPVTSISAVAHGAGSDRDQIDTLTSIRQFFAPGSWLHTEAGRLLCGMASDLQADAVETAQRDQHAQHDGASEVVG